MPKQRLSSADIRNVIELRHSGGSLSCRRIAQQVGVGPSSAHKVLKSAYGPFLEAIQAGSEVTDAMLLQWVYPNPSHTKHTDWARVHYQLQSGMTRKFCFEQLRSEEKAFFGYSRFCELYNEWLSAQPASSSVHCMPAHTCIVSVIECTVADRRSPRMSLFVGLLPASNYLYLDAYVPNGSPFELFDCMARLFAHVGGVPQQVVIPPIKGIEDYRLLERTLGTSVTVSVPRKQWSGPGSDLASSAFNWVASQLAAYRKSQLALMKVKLQVLAAEWNSSGLDYYPAEPIQRALERVERCRLNALIKTSDAFTHRKSVKVGLSSHVKYGMVFYSVPYALVGQAVEVEASADRVRVYNGQRLVADHPRQASTYYQTKPAHMRTRGAQVARERSRDRFMSWAIRIGRNTTKWVRTRMDQAEYPEHAYESCRRLLSLANIHGPKRLERACGRRGVRTMDDIRKILSRAD